MTQTIQATFTLRAIAVEHIPIPSARVRKPPRPKADSKLRWKRGFRTRDAEMDLAGLPGELADD